MWVHSHIGFTENERADAAAKNSISLLSQNFQSKRLSGIDQSSTLIKNEVIFNTQQVAFQSVIYSYHERDQHWNQCLIVLPETVYI